MEKIPEEFSSSKFGPSKPGEGERFRVVCALAGRIAKIHKNLYVSGTSGKNKLEVNKLGNNQKSAKIRIEGTRNIWKGGHVDFRDPVDSDAEQRLAV